MNRFLIFLIAIVGLPLSTKAQKIFYAKGSAEIRVESNFSLNEAKKQVRDLAIVNAIESVLGTYVEQETNIKITGGKTDFATFGNTRVKGDWLETEKEKFENLFRDADKKSSRTVEQWIRCEIAGTVREITRPKLTFESDILACPQRNCHAGSFSSGSQMYLYFRTPSRGNLSIYAVQEDGMVYRLLPYTEMSFPYDDSIPVEADREYVFFHPSANHDYFPDFPFRRIDEMILETTQSAEWMEFYLVFSTDKFNKPLLAAGKEVENGMLPKSLSKEKFDEWVRKNRIYNPDFNYEVKRVEIVRR